MNRRDYLNVAAKTVSFALNLLISFFLTSYVVENVSTEAYGYVGLGNDFINYAQIFTMALNSMASRFIVIEFERKNNKSANQFFSSLFFMNIGLSIVFTLIAGVVIPNIDKMFKMSDSIIVDVKILWTFLSINFIVGLINTVFQVSTFYRKRLDLDAIRTTVGTIIKAIILFLLYKCMEPRVWYVGFGTAVAGIYALGYGIYYTKILLPEAKISADYFSGEKVSILLKSGMWNSVTRLGNVLSSGLDLYITNIFVNGVAMGVLSISKQIPKYILNLFATIAGVFEPGLMSAYAVNDFDSVQNQIESAIRFCSFFAAFPLVVMFSFGKEFYALWVPSQDTQLLYILTVISCALYIFHLPLQPIWSLFTVYNKLKISSCYLLAESIVSIIVELFVLQFAHSDASRLIIIVGVSGIIQFVRSILLLPLYSAKAMNVRLNVIYRILMKNLLIVSACFALSLVIKRLVNITSWISLILACVYICVVTFIFEFLFMIDKPQKLRIYNYLRRFLPWKK